jgi:hypothetical protein
MVREIAKSVLGVLADTVRPRAVLVTENILLRQQLLVLQRAKPHPRVCVTRSWKTDGSSDIRTRSWSQAGSPHGQLSHEEP